MFRFQLGGLPRCLMARQASCKARGIFAAAQLQRL